MSNFVIRTGWHTKTVLAHVRASFSIADVLGPSRNFSFSKVSCDDSNEVNVAQQSDKDDATAVAELRKEVRLMCLKLQCPSPSLYFFGSLFIAGYKSFVIPSPSARMAGARFNHWEVGQEKSRRSEAPSLGRPRPRTFTHSRKSRPF